MAVKGNTKGLMDLTRLAANRVDRPPRGSSSAIDIFKPEDDDLNALEPNEERLTIEEADRSEFCFLLSTARIHSRRHDGKKWMRFGLRESKGFLCMTSVL